MSTDTYAYNGTAVRCQPTTARLCQASQNGGRIYVPSRGPGGTSWPKINTGA
jgi:hypothetical protein